jgi:hypothetical protein
MKGMPAPSNQPEQTPRRSLDLGSCPAPALPGGAQASSAGRPSVFSVTRSLLTHPLRTFVIHWNWKAGFLSGVFRAALFAIAVVPREPAALRGVAIQLAFRVAIGGMWGSLAQAFREAEPAWLAGVFVAAVLPAGVHLVEYAALRAGHVSHIRAGMIASVSLSVISLLLNWGLMRKGLLLTGKGTDSFATDLSRLPSALIDFLLAGPRLLARVLRGCFA